MKYLQSLMSMNTVLFHGDSAGKINSGYVSNKCYQGEVIQCSKTTRFENMAKWQQSRLNWCMTPLTSIE